MNNNQNHRIGYYACQWGINIRSKVDCDELVEYVKGFGDEIIISKKGVFLKWLELNNKMGGQNKIPRLSNERKFIESLIELNN